MSWIASASSLDHTRLALLRENGFQPQRTERLWRWSIGDAAALASLPAPLQLRPLHRRNAPLLWHLEQATCPAPLRQVLDRLEDSATGRLLPASFHCEVPPDRLAQARVTAAILGDGPRRVGGTVALGTPWSTELDGGGPLVGWGR